MALSTPWRRYLSGRGHPRAGGAVPPCEVVHQEIRSMSRARIAKRDVPTVKFA